MKKIFFIIFIVILTSSNIFAVEKAVLDKPIETTSGTMLLMQADIISLYFSKTDFAYTTKLEDNKLNVKGVLLNDSLLYNRSALQQLLKRQVASFTKTLDDRIGLYVADIKNNFKANKDANFEFITKSGEKIATHSNGKWDFKPMKNLPVIVSAQATTQDVTKNIDETKEYVDADFWCNCPSLIKKKTKKITEEQIGGEQKPVEQEKTEEEKK